MVNVSSEEFLPCTQYCSCMFIFTLKKWWCTENRAENQSLNCLKGRGGKRREQVTLSQVTSSCYSGCTGMKSSATQTITVTHISEVSLFRHDLSHLKVQKNMSSSALLLEHFFNRIWTESAQYLKEYNTQSSGLLMILYFLCTLKAWIQKRLA